MLIGIDYPTVWASIVKLENNLLSCLDSKNNNPVDICPFI